MTTPEVAELVTVRRRLGAHAKRHLRDRDFASALLLYGSERRAIKLVEWSVDYAMTDDELRDVLREWWSVIEGWGGHPLLRRAMIALLRRVGYVSNPACRLQGDLMIYRGNAGEDPRLGHSWTLSKSTARYFARQPFTGRGIFLGMARSDGRPTVWGARVSAADVLGYWNDRKEKEIVVDPETLRDIEIMMHPPRPRC